MASFRSLVALRHLSGHRWLRAIRNSLVLLLPVTFVGAMAVLLGSLPLAALSPQLHAAFGNSGSSLATLVGNASNGILAVFLVVLVSHSLALESWQRDHIELSPPVVATVALVNFFIFLQRSEPVSGQFLMGSHSILAAMLVASGDIDARERLGENYPTSALAAISFAADDWNGIHAQGGRLEHFVTPRWLETATD